MQQNPNQPNYPPYNQPPYNPQQQPPYSQYQQPPYPPQYNPQPPVQKKRGRGCLIASIVTIAVIVVIIVAVAASSNGKGQATNTTTSTTTTQSSTATQSTQPSSGAHKVGESVTVGGWGVAVKSVKTSQTDPLNQLKSGDTYLEIVVSLKNNTGSNQTFSSLLSFSLTDSNGQKYDQSLTSGQTSPDGSVVNGNPLQGTLAYEVPQSTKSFILTFTPALGSTDSATWDLNL